MYILTRSHFILLKEPKHEQNMYLCQARLSEEKEEVLTCISLKSHQTETCYKMAHNAVTLQHTLWDTLKQEMEPFPLIKLRQNNIRLKSLHGTQYISVILCYT